VRGGADPLAALDHERIARFAGDLARLWPEGERLGLGVSGGPDSLALLLLAAAVNPSRIEVATVDHGLRPESAGEAALVEKYCAQLGVRHEVLSVSVPGGNMQDAARGARYGVLGQWAKRRGLAAIATAHHADDQAETLLMRLNRGSGIGGLAGVRARGRAVGTDLPVLRPLLTWRRDELHEIVAQSGWQAVRDPSNDDPRFDRARVRAALKDAPWINPAALAASASHIAEGEEVLGWAAAQEWERCVSVREGEIRYRPSAPRAIRLRIVMRAIGLLGGNPRGGSVGLLMRRLAAGRDATLAGCVVRVEGDEWVFRREPPRRVQGPL
jgi:tRNA(Ile)-lysidine synthase